jgi:hypothetical protein
MRYVFGLTLLILLLAGCDKTSTGSNNEDLEEHISFTRNEVAKEFKDFPTYSDLRDSQLDAYFIQSTGDLVAGDHYDEISIFIPENAREGETYDKTTVNITYTEARTGDDTLYLAGPLYANSSISLTIDELGTNGPNNYIRGTFSATLINLDDENTMVLTEGAFTIEMF